MAQENLMCVHLVPHKNIFVKRFRPGGKEGTLRENEKYRKRKREKRKYKRHMKRFANRLKQEKMKVKEKTNKKFMAGERGGTGGT